MELKLTRRPAVSPNAAQCKADRRCKPGGNHEELRIVVHLLLFIVHLETVGEIHPLKSTNRPPAGRIPHSVLSTLYSLC